MLLGVVTMHGGLDGTAGVPEALLPRIGSTLLGQADDTSRVVRRSAAKRW
jgi:hypothetical protein